MAAEVLGVRSVGFWLAAIGALLMFVNAARALADPASFATYLGLPLADGADAGLVKIYALRAIFIGLLIAALLATGQRSALFWLAICAAIMPAGDAYLANEAGASVATVMRHAAIGVYLMVTAIVLRP